MKELTFRLFKCNFPLEKCLQDPVGKTEDRLAAPHGKNSLQIRHVQRDKNNIYGRLCKLRKEGKPNIGSANSPNEETIEKDVIEASCFRYFVDSRFLLIQQNQHVGTSLNGSILKVLRHVQEETGTQSHPLTSDDEITPAIEDKALQKILTNRHLITKMKVYVPKQTRFLFSLEDDELLTGDEKIFTEHEEIKLESKISNGQAAKKTIEKIFDFFNKGKIKNAAFDIEGEPSFALDSCLKRAKIEFDDGKFKKTEEYKAIYEALAKRKITSEEEIR